jgi:tetratricopeptide (TPR) repeat protein
VADCYLAMGKQQGPSHPQAAMNSLTRARSILEALTARHPQVAPYQARLANCYSEIGIILAQRGSADRGLDLLEKAKAIQQRLIDQRPGEPEYRRSLAEMINVWGYVYFEKLDYAAALRSFHDVRDICQALLDRVTSGPKPVWALDLLGLSYYNIATIQLRRGEREEALKSFEQSLVYRDALVSAHPSVNRFQENLGMTFREVARYQHDAGQDAKAHASIQRSFEVLERLVRSQPDQAGYRSELGHSWNTLGFLRHEAREERQAIPAFKEAVIEQQRAVALAPDVDLYKVYLCNHLENLGEQYVDLGQVAEAYPHYEQAIQIRRELHDAHPESQIQKLELAQALATLGTIQRHAGQSSTARQSFARARAVLETGPTAVPSAAALQGPLGSALAQEAGTLADLHQPEAALPLLRQAVNLLQARTRSASEDTQERERLTEALWQLARILRILGKSAEADRYDVERAWVWKGRPARDLATLALKEASQAALIGYGKTPVPAPGKAVAQLDLDQAAANLRLAVSLGFRDLSMVRSHLYSTLLLSRDDLQSLIRDLEFPDQPFQSQLSN